MCAGVVDGVQVAVHVEHSEKKPDFAGITAEPFVAMVDIRLGTAGPEAPARLGVDLPAVPNTQRVPNPARWPLRAAFPVPAGSAGWRCAVTRR